MFTLLQPRLPLDMGGSAILCFLSYSVTCVWIISILIHVNNYPWEIFLDIKLFEIFFCFMLLAQLRA